jgi:hypothetical protein
MNGNEPATKADVDQLRQELRTAERFVIGIQITYFFGTLASVWFMVNQMLTSINQSLSQILAHLK